MSISCVRNDDTPLFMTKHDGSIPVPPFLTTTVTPADIKDGERFNGFECPIALATQRVFSHPSINVTSFWIVLNGYCYRLPKHAQHFVQAFDLCHPADRSKFLPFTFTTGPRC